MRRIKAEEASVGDVLAEPLTNESGQVLLPRGAKLSAAVLSRLPGWGVRMLAIEGEGEDDSGPDELLAALDERFADVEDDALMMELKAIARGHLLRP